MSAEIQRLRYAVPEALESVEPPLPGREASGNRAVNRITMLTAATHSGNRSTTNLKNETLKSMRAAVT